MKSKLNAQLAQAKLYFDQGEAHRRKQEYPEALASFERAISLNPNYAEAYWKRGNILLTTGHHDAAAACYRLAAAIRDDYPEAYHNLGIALQHMGEYAQALDSLSRAIALKPHYPSAYNSLGVVYKNLGQPEQELECYRQAIAQHPEFAEAHNNLGNAYTSQDRLTDALDCYQKAVVCQPQFVQAHANRGKVLRLMRQYLEAAASLELALKLDPDHADAWFHQGLAYDGLQDYAQAAASFQRYVALRPEDVNGYLRLGAAQKMLGLYKEAEKTLTQAVKIQPKCAEAYFNLGLACHELKKYLKALAHYDKAIALAPEHAAAYYNNRGTTLFSMQQTQDALACFDLALKHSPAYPLAHLNRGTALQCLNQHQAALDCFLRVIELEPDNAEARGYAAIALQELKRYPEALQHFDQALALKPGFEFLYGLRLMCKLQLCDWSDLRQEFTRIRAALPQGEKVTPPFQVFAVTDSAALHKQAALIWAAAKYPSEPGAKPAPRPASGGKIRVGYFSSDFREHPVGLLIAELIELHDRENFEIIAFSLDPVSHNPVSNRLRAAFDQFIDIHPLSDQQAAELARNLNLDIAVDLNGYTQHGRPGLFAQRAAPVQISYLGYPGPLGADWMDYLIADNTVIPEQIRGEFTENIIYLPHSYLVNDSSRPISGKPLRRTDFGLPETGMVYCCFNNSYKITPRVFNLWTKILNTVPGSVLWLSAGPEAHDNLLRAAESLGLDPKRIIFATRVEAGDEHLARLSLADLFLDCFPYNAHTTAADALWSGLPVLTCAGGGFPSRVAASLLHAMELPELVTYNHAAYQRLAISLGRHPERLAALKRKLRQNRLDAPLFDTRRFARNLEAAYRQVHQRSRDGLEPGDLTIAENAKA